MSTNPLRVLVPVVAIVGVFLGTDRAIRALALLYSQLPF